MIKTSSCLDIIDSVAANYSIPISLDDVASYEGLCVIYDDYGKDTFDGMTWYVPEDDTFFIHMNIARGNTKGSRKGRFTLAHELGHYLIDHHRHALECGKMTPHIHRYNPFGRNEEWEIERQADEFAANLLMPYSQFRNEFERKTFSGQLIQIVAEKYQVSFSACALRYMNMGFQPIMLVYAEDGMVKWQMRSDNFPFYRLRYGTSKVPENSVIGDYFFQNDSTCCKQSEIVNAGDCFHTYNEEQNSLQFYEYCIPYKNSAFSIFWEC